MKKNVFSFATSSFGYGISKVMDINGSNIKKIKIGTFVDDAASLSNDWITIGNDIRKAMSDYERNPAQFKDK